MVLLPVGTWMKPGLGAWGAFLGGTDGPGVCTNLGGTLGRGVLAANT